MIALKKLTFAVDKLLHDKNSINKEQLRLLTDEAITYLKEAKCFEYIGEIKLPYAAFKLVDLNMDFDDVVKSLVDKKNNIEFNGELRLIINEVKNEEKAS